MKLTLTWQERRALYQLLRPYLKNDKVQQMNAYIQHGSVSTLQHCKYVAEMSCWLNNRFHLGANQKALMIGALLHDFYLYDWHVDENHEHPLHGFSHPEAARKNAQHYFRIGKQTQDVIRCHMWPLTLTQVPTSRAAIIVCIADKYCSLYETLFLRKRKERTRT